MRKYKVDTYYYPADSVQNESEMFLAYLTYQGSGTIGQKKTYEVEAENGTKAKQIALRMRKAEIRGKI